MIEYKTQGSRVYGENGGGSYNCTNRITAQELCHKLNELEKYKHEHAKTTEKLDNITRDIIRLNITISTLHEEITQIRQRLEQ